MTLKITRNYDQSKLIPLYFSILVYGFWLYGQGPIQAIENLSEQIHIALTMVFGSFVAGGTALGGGAIAFPVMTKALSIEPATAKIFSLAIQSFGMTAAALTIIFGGIRYYKNVVVWALIGAIPGIIISLTWIDALIPRLAVKSLFSFFIFCFAVTLIRLQVSEKTVIESNSWQKTYWITLVGFVGGITSGLIGSGADIAIFALLVLFYKKDLKASTATSVIVMAVTSVVASAYNFYFLESFTSQINQYVLAAMPIVVIGAPLGAYFCAKVKPKVLMLFLLMLIAIEVSFTIFEVLN